MATRTDSSQERANAVADSAIPGVDLMTPEEGRAHFDRRVEEALGISGDEFLRRWDSGMYRPVPDTSEGRKIGRLVMLMPFARRTKS